MRALTAADDDLHTPTSDDIYWTETAWFACSIPEKRVTLHVYPVFRTNVGICSSGMYLWDHTGMYNHEALYSHNYWHLPLPSDLTTMRLPSGLSYDRLEPLRRYHVRYDSDQLKVDLVYTGLTEPILNAKEDHIDQPCHVTGSIDLGGQRLAVDGFEMRDKSWHVRADDQLALPPDISKGSYTYAIRKETAFLARTSGADANATQVNAGGWLWRDGVAAPLVSGHRYVTRQPRGLGEEIIVEGSDSMGRTFRAVGRTVSHFAYQSTPAILAWLRGVEWEFDGQPTWGEDQEWDALPKPPKKIV